MKRYCLSNIKISAFDEDSEILRALANKGIKCGSEDFDIIKKSLDARNKNNLQYIYQIAFKCDFNARNVKCRDLVEKEFKTYEMPKSGLTEANGRHVVIGAGPAGLFSALILAKAGYKPLIIERGEPVEKRKQKIKSFWDGGSLDTESNVCYGEGGAGTFSDGKLTTGVKDENGREAFVLDTFVNAGADPSIKYWHKPHIGSDVLESVIKNIRNEIILCGGEFLFDTKVIAFKSVSDGIKLTLSKKGSSDSEIIAQSAVLAIGHSARDTYDALKSAGADMSLKDFAVGVRIEHPQQMIQLAQYGTSEGGLPAADYKLTAKLADGRGAYTFCMCPGGYVVNSSSETDGLCINGMSYSGRGGANANSAVLITVGKADYGSDDIFAGVRFQRELEKSAFNLAGGRIPQQLYKDFCTASVSKSYGLFESQTKGASSFADVNSIFPDRISSGICEGIEDFGKRLTGFNRDDAVLSGIEGRTSSPLRINRDEHFESNIKYLFPCGEGAGYAGGIMSAAMDGMKVAEEIIRRYKPC